MPRVAQQVELPDADRGHLNALVRQRSTVPAMILRARIVLLVINIGLWRTTLLDSCDQALFLLKQQSAILAWLRQRYPKTVGEAQVAIEHMALARMPSIAWKN